MHRTDRYGFFKRFGLYIAKTALQKGAVFFAAETGLRPVSTNVLRVFYLVNLSGSSANIYTPAFPSEVR